MVSPDPKIQSYRDDEVQPTEDRFLKKAPTRDFREVAKEVDEKRYREDENEKTEKKSSTDKKQGVTKGDKKPADALPSPFDLVRNAKNRSKDDDEEQKQQPHEEVADEDDLTINKKKASTQNLSATHSNSHPQFVPEQYDLSSVNPLAGQTQTAPIAFNDATVKTTAPTAPANDLQEIIDRLTKEIYTLETSGKTDTIITLKGPLFDQSRLIVSEFDSAKGQFNITIDNLTQAAKNLIDQNQSSLLSDLNKKGYMVHIVTTTTTIEAPRIESSQLHQDNSKRDNPDQQRRQKQGKEER